MKIAYAPYLLKKKNSPSSQQGALLKIIDGSSWGVADLCPKPELGDNNLENEINKRGSLYQRAVELAFEDLAARKKKISLLSDKFIKNNFLITDYKTVDLNPDLYIHNTIKIKADRDLSGLSHFLSHLVSDIVVRIDFNSVLSIEEYEYFLNLLSAEAKLKIEYVEDPTPINIKWKNWNALVPLAFDFQSGEYDANFAKYRIIKPSRQKVIKDLTNVTLTSAMDHPVGVAHGLRIAQQVAQNDSGFLTLDLFEENRYNKYFAQKNSYLNFSPLALGQAAAHYGIGMNEELDKIKWTEL